MELIEVLYTLLISCVPAVLSGIGSFLLAKSKSKAEIKQMQVANEHEIEKLMEQHKVDIDAIREQHRLEMQAKDKEHAHKLEIMQIEHKNELARKEHELENAAKYGAMGNIITSLFNGAVGNVINSADVQGELSKLVVDSMRRTTNGK